MIRRLITAVVPDCSGFLAMLVATSCASLMGTGLSCLTKRILVDAPQAAHFRVFVPGMAASGRGRDNQCRDSRRRVDAGSDGGALEMTRYMPILICSAQKSTIKAIVASAGIKGLPGDDTKPRVSVSISES